MDVSFSVESKQYFGSYKTAIVFEEMEKWFFWSGKNKMKQNGFNTFWKFVNPAKKHKAYRQGDSWQEAIGMERRAFNRAFGKIGIRHRSKTDFMKSPDKFQGKPFACYFDRKAAQMTFVRNDLVADQICSKIRGRKNNNKYYEKLKENENGRSCNGENRLPDPPPTRARIYNNTNTTTIKAISPQKEPSIPPKVELKPEESSLVGKMIEIWNTAMRDSISNAFSTPYVRKVIDIFNQWFKNSMDEWEKYCYKIASSKFCTGEAMNTKFKAWFTWAVKPEIIQKIRDGLYGVGEMIVKSPSEIEKAKISREIQKISQEILFVEKSIEHSIDEIEIAQNKRVTEEINAMSEERKDAVLKELKEDFNQENPVMDWFTKKIYDFKSYNYLRDHVRKQLNFCPKQEIQAPEELIKLRQDLQDFLDKKNKLLDNFSLPTPNSSSQEGDRANEQSH